MFKNLGRKWKYFLCMDPDPAKCDESDRIRIHNPGIPVPYGWYTYRLFQTHNNVKLLTAYVPYN